VESGLGAKYQGMSCLCDNVIGRKMRNRNQLTAAFSTENCNDTLAKDTSLEMLFCLSFEKCFYVTVGSFYCVVLSLPSQA